MTSAEDIFFIFATTIIVGGILSAAARLRLNMMVFLLINFGATLVGLAVLSITGASDWNTFSTYALGIVALTIGYVVASRRRPQQRGASKSLRSIDDRVVLSIVLIAGLLGLYHLIASGIPIFSSSIETKRFDFTSSGFFGVPGRMFLYGIPIAWMLASATAESRGIRWRSYVPWRFATGFFAVTSLLSGFKSGLLAVTYTMLIAFFIISRYRITVGTFARKYWWAFLVPLVYGVSVATSYSSYDVAGEPLWRQLLTRLTLVQATPVQHAMEGRAAGFIENGLLNDLNYYALKYTGRDSSFLFSLERAVSAEMIGADPSSNAWTTPVTLGGFAELCYSFGPAIAAVAMIFVGIFIARIHHSERRGVLRLTTSAVLAFGLYNWLLKGGLVYYALNLVAVATMLLCIGIVVSLFCRKQKHSRATSSPLVPVSMHGDPSLATTLRSGGFEQPAVQGR